MDVIHCKLPTNELVMWGNRIGELVKPNMDCGRYNHACSDIISIEMVAELGLVSDLCKHTYSEIVSSFQLMTRWVNLSKTVMCMRTAAEHWLDVQANVVFDDNYLRTSIEDYPQKIHEDICIFAAWCIYMGADPASIRKTMPSKVQDDTRKIYKKIGASGIISMLWRSLVAYGSMTEKAIIPKYRECFKHGRKETANMGLMQSAFAQLKKSA